MVIWRDYFKSHSSNISHFSVYSLVTVRGSLLFAHEWFEICKNNTLNVLSPRPLLYARLKISASYSPSSQIMPNYIMPYSSPEII
jgi:hypothetical protein